MTQLVPAQPVSGTVTSLGIMLSAVVLEVKGLAATMLFEMPSMRQLSLQGLAPPRRAGFSCQAMTAGLPTSWFLTGPVERMLQWM